MFRRCLALVIVVVALVVPPLARSARADQSTAHSVGVAVLAFDSDDAEEQADALTGAMRARVRAADGWSLVETPQSLGMLTAALRCPAKPVSAECEQRIADQLKLDRFIYGYVAKGPSPAQVTAEVHLYQRSKPDTVRRETYSDNLRDQNDEALRKIAYRLLDGLAATTVGTVVVHLGREGGEVIVDGEKRVPLQNGVARVELSPGGHAVEVILAGQTASQKRNVVVTAGKETVVTLGVPAPPGASTEPAAPFPTRKVVGATLAGAGVVLAIVSVANVLSYESALDRGDVAEAEAARNPVGDKLPPGKTADDACGSDLLPTAPICVANSDANRSSTVAWVTGGAGAVLLGAGAYLFLSAGGKERKASKAPRVAPTIGRGSGGLVLSGSF
jgi:hypothetical protein